MHRRRKREDRNKVSKKNLDQKSRMSKTDQVHNVLDLYTKYSRIFTQEDVCLIRRLCEVSWYCQEFYMETRNDTKKGAKRNGDTLYFMRSWNRCAQR